MSQTPKRPNILFLMTDQMQGRVLDPGHPCKTPNLDRLAARGVRFSQAYTPNPICSPARASLMTGLLPHNHGVLTVTHCVDDDQSCLREGKPHWAQRLVEAGCRTGYFGKWHVERSHDLARFGWQTHLCFGSDAYRQKREQMLAHEPAVATSGPDVSARWSSNPGYSDALFYAVTDEPPQRRGLGVTCRMAGEWLADAIARTSSAPWCCFVSLQEPHDPFVAGRAAFERYDVDAIELPENFADDLADRPGLYRKAAQIFAHLTDRQKREALACYYASITEIDEQFGRLIDQIGAAGELDNTIVIVTTDHGECAGAHGLYMKNVGAFEEIYNIPLIVAGPGVARGTTSAGRVGLHDLAPTLCELASAEPIDNADCRSFARMLQKPAAHQHHYSQGFAEYHGTRQMLTQRIVWDGPWKYVHNGFDFDELYNLDDDPGELKNLAADPAYVDQVRRMMTLAWSYMKKTGDHTMVNTHYPVLRLAPVGPDAVDQ